VLAEIRNVVSGQTPYYRGNTAKIIGDYQNN